MYIEIPTIERAQLPGWIGTRLAAQGQSADRQGLDFIADRVEGNLLAAHQEIQKLGLLHEPGKLTFEQIHDAVLNVARYDVFKLSRGDAGGRRGAAGAHARRPEGRGRGAAAGVVGRRRRNPHAVKIEIRDGAGTAARRAAQGIPHLGPERAHDGAGAAAHLRCRRWKRRCSEAAQVDKMVKGLRAKAFAGDAWDAMLQLALKVARG